MSSAREPASPRAAVIAVGTELVADGRPDTNGVTIARHLAAFGYETVWRLAVPDDETLIAQALNDAAGRHSVVVVTGGLGPTVDDVTREAAARAFGLPLQEDAALRDLLRRRYESRGRVFSSWSARQAMVPLGAEPLPNEAGTAPGLLLRRPGGTLVALLPGVPHEMERMLEKELLPRLAGAARAAAGRLVARGLKTFGLTEVEVQERVLDLFAGGSAGTPSLTLLASPGEITLIVRGRDETAVGALFAQARERLGDRVFTEDPSTSLEHAVGRRLEQRGLTLATAESCTGGLLGALVTAVPGSSRWYLQGWVTYSNESKIAQLGVESALVAAHGAVSAEVADAMALGAQRLSGARMAVSITGIAGPEGGTADKPVGLVYVSLAAGAGARATRHLFAGDRDTVRRLAARTALGRILIEAA